MKAIHKFLLKGKSKQRLFLQKGFKILKAGTQKGVPTLWALVDTEKPETEIEILIYYTGSEIEQDLSRIEHLGTLLLHKEELIIHIFKSIS